MLKIKVEEEQAKLASRKEDEKNKQAIIMRLKVEVEGLDDISKQPMELSEEAELKELEKKCEELNQLYEDQQERTSITKNQHRDLEERKARLNDKAKEHTDKIAVYEQKIRENIDLSKKKNEEKIELGKQEAQMKDEKTAL